MLDKSIRVLIVDDHQLMIEGLKSLLECEEDIVFAGGANSMAETLTRLSQTKVDVVLMDINMPDGSGIDTTIQLKKYYPQVKVIALTMHDDISIITRMIQAGASGYILKRTNMNEVIDAIRVVARNGRYLSNYAQNIVLDNLAAPALTPEVKEDAKPLLSSREMEVLKLVAKEYSNEQIAGKLFISERTVEAHRRNIFIKTKTKSIVGLIKYAINNGLVDGDNDNF